MLQALVLDLDRINALAEQIVDDIIVRAVQLISFLHNLSGISLSE